MIFNPDNFLRLIFSKDFFKGKILNSEMELKQEMLRALLKSAGVSKRDVSATVYKVVDFYNKKIKELKKEGEKSYKKKALNGEVLLKNRLENLVLWNEVQNMKKEHEGQFYRWLPSSAKEPDPEHQLLYGKIFKVGEGDKDGNMPSERFGCKCGIEFLSDKKEVSDLENMEVSEPEIPLEAEFEDVKSEKIEIVKETKKAFLIEKDGKQAWIQKRWLRDDGTLTAKGEEAIKNSTVTISEARAKQAEIQNIKAVKKQTEERLKSNILELKKWVNPANGEERIYVNFFGKSAEMKAWLEYNAQDDSYIPRVKIVEDNVFSRNNFYYQDRMNNIRAFENSSLSEFQNKIDEFKKIHKIKVLNREIIKKFIG